MENTKEIRLSKAITAIVDGQSYSLTAGRQRVPANVADHWFVKAHATDAGSDDTMEDMRDAQIVELSTQNGQLRQALELAEKNAGEAQSFATRYAALEAERDALTVERDDLLKKSNDLEAAAAADTKSAQAEAKRK